MIARKTCCRCGETKPVSDMKKDNRNGDGFSSFCKLCHKKASIAWQRANPEKLNATRRKRYARIKDELNAKRRGRYRSNPEIGRRNIRYLYKTTVEWYNEQLERQGNRCAICGKLAGSTERQFSIDHDHSCCPTTPTCGKCNRGILCHTCNTTLHAIDGNKDWLKSAINYLGLGWTDDEQIRDHS